jgi:DEAD/DEAH box helicase domain-containing protein
VEQFGRVEGTPSGPDVQEILGLLAEQGLVHRTGGSDDLDRPSTEGQWTWTNESYPADAVSLRSVSSDNFVIVDTTGETRVIGETDFSSGPATLHQKAIYIVEGRLYQVERLDFEGRKAFVREIDCDYYTDAITYTRVTAIDTFAERREPGALFSPCAHGEVHVVSRVVGFKKIKFYTNENVGSGELDLPEQQMHTTSYWLTIPQAVAEVLPYASEDRRDGIVGLAFAMRQIAQLLLMCDRHDVGISIDSEDDREGKGPDPGFARIFIYDNYPGGIGFSEPLFRMHDELVAGTRRLIAECECAGGCPGCVGPVFNTGSNTGSMAKAVALRILDLLLAPSAVPVPQNRVSA